MLRNSPLKNEKEEANVRKMAMLVSHPLASEQEREAKEAWKVEQFLPLPEDLQQIWSQVPPEEDFPVKRFQLITDWLEQQTAPQDLVWIQGEPGAVFLLVTWCFQNNRIPIYATTKREYSQQLLPDGSIKNQHIFRHVNFRVYPCGE